MEPYRSADHAPDSASPFSTAELTIMARALERAREAGAAGEIPVGAVIVRRRDDAPAEDDDIEAFEIVAEAGNRKEAAQDPLGHAEILAIRAAAEKLGRWRLSDCWLFVTLEPCAMCAGAIVHARLARLVYGALDQKAGAVASLYQILEDPRLNHSPEVKGGARESECSELLRGFFRSLRERARSAK